MPASRLIAGMARSCKWLTQKVGCILSARINRRTGFHRNANRQLRFSGSCTVNCLILCRHQILITHVFWGATIPPTGPQRLSM